MAAKSKSMDEETDKLREQLKKERHNIVIYKRPITTLANFGVVLLKFLLDAIKALFAHRFALPVGLPLVAAWIALSFVDGSHHLIMEEIWKSSEWLVWWVGLGVLSSVGLGTGMHSGFLFLFPHIFKVVCIAEVTCKSTNFSTRDDMWFREDASTFACLSPDTEEQVTLLRLFLMTIPPAFAWGAGTAIGEIPPYLITRAARLAGKKNAEFDGVSLMDEITGDDVVSKMKRWMIDYIQKYGFWGVFLFSAWPNAAFDLCGICCGHFMMPFWTFFGATFLGKAGVKAILQAIGCTIIFSKHTRASILQAISTVSPAWVVDQLSTVFDRVNAKFDQDAPQEEEAGSGLVKQAWTAFMFLLIGSFALSCVHQFAQSRQAELDKITLEKADKKK